MRYLIYSFEGSLHNDTHKKIYNDEVKRLSVPNRWFLLTLGNAWRFIIKNDNGEIIHTSIFMKKSIKFNFMDKKSFIIGPSCTEPHYRGRGLFPYAIHRIIEYAFDIRGGVLPGFTFW